MPWRRSSLVLGFVFGEMGVVGGDGNDLGVFRGDVGAGHAYSGVRVAADTGRIVSVIFFL